MQFITELKRDNDEKMRFIDIFLIILVGWIVIDFFTNAASNLIFNFLCFDKNNFFDSLIASLIFLIIFVVLVNSFDSKTKLGVERYFGAL